ncbi:MAG: hypothetical protein QM674_20955 [Burkholderiaceae bacterium]
MKTSAWPWALLLLVLLALAVLAGVTWGSAQLGIGQVWAVVRQQLLQYAGLASALDDGAMPHYQIVWMIRLPRVLMAALLPVASTRATTAR